MRVKEIEPEHYEAIEKAYSLVSYWQNQRNSKEYKKACQEMHRVTIKCYPWLEGAGAACSRNSKTGRIEMIVFNSPEEMINTTRLWEGMTGKKANVAVSDTRGNLHVKGEE